MAFWDYFTRKWKSFGERVKSDFLQGIYRTERYKSRKKLEPKFIARKKAVMDSKKFITEIEWAKLEIRHQKISHELILKQQKYNINYLLNSLNLNPKLTKKEYNSSESAASLLAAIKKLIEYEKSLIELELVNEYMKFLKDHLREHRSAGNLTISSDKGELTVSEKTGNLSKKQ